MSVDLLNLSYKQKNLSLSEKSILSRMCWHANEHGECYASITSLRIDTSMDRKTAQKALLTLETKGLLIKTNKFVGKTKSIPVYQVDLSCPKNGTPSKTSDPVFSASDPVFSDKQSQKRDTERLSFKDNKKNNSDAYATSTSKTKKPTITELQEFSHGVKGYEWVGEWRKENGYG